MGKATRHNPSSRLNAKRLLSCCLLLAGVILAVAACGKDDAQEPAKGGQGRGADAGLGPETDAPSGTDGEGAGESGKDSNGAEDEADGPIAVADFSYMLLDKRSE